MIAAQSLLSNGRCLQSNYLATAVVKQSFPSNWSTYHTTRHKEGEKSDMVIIKAKEISMRVPSMCIVTK